MRLAFFCSSLAAALSMQTVNGSESGEIVLECFQNPSHDWFMINDPVMGGKSTGVFVVDNGVGTIDGKVDDVPFLKVPGFIAVKSRDLLARYPDVSSCNSLKLTLRSSIDYDGYRVSFGDAHPPHSQTFAFGYKANFEVPAGDEFVAVEIPFQNFSDMWDEATGDQIKSCKEYPEYCPDQKTLEDIKTVSIWAEGVAGNVHLELKEISATGCSGDSPMSK